ncbi:putative regulator of Ras-like GTPase activity (Roadblock/LC7/MglB family) [Marinobacterium halophilum]|uniref:Putative regulator of Ras-like GTPase activity (Roadblock/LC7/MglB family) n=1 Tax=Marinobacterium halophilum TaxID=267374 RepID=A0A2P8ERZ3_9GAMM|nr:roadblock/LC7 domain-containing protein [Marinobacterium halophilum]PSL12195.1 putative regulator of Ras-like GTPase activity (Roadblock/LC7/MglB family) [Marinobacterium halophilum]
MNVMNLSTPSGLADVLGDKVKEYDGLQFLLVATADGFLVADSGQKHLNKEWDANRIASMAVSFCALSHSMADECDLGVVQGASVQGDNGMMLARLILSGEAEYVLLASFENRINNGLANWALQKIFESVSDCLKK